MTITFYIHSSVAEAFVHEKILKCPSLFCTFKVSLNLSPIFFISSHCLSPVSYRCQILLPFLFLCIFVPKFENCYPSSHWGLCDLFMNLLINGKTSSDSQSYLNGHKRGIVTSVYYGIPKNGFAALKLVANNF